jgi:hypothetical protein
MTHQEAAVGVLSGRGGATGDDATISAWPNERVVQQEATQQPGGTSKGDGASRGCGALRNHVTTSRASGRQQHVVGKGIGRTVATVG